MKHCFCHRKQFCYLNCILPSLLVAVLPDMSDFAGDAWFKLTCEMALRGDGVARLGCCLVVFKDKCEEARLGDIVNVLFLSGFSFDVLKFTVETAFLGEGCRGEGGLNLLLLLLSPLSGELRLTCDTAFWGGNENRLACLVVGNCVVDADMAPKRLPVPKPPSVPSIMPLASVLAKKLVDPDNDSRCIGMVSATVPTGWKFIPSQHKLHNKKATTCN